MTAGSGTFFAILPCRKVSVSTPVKRPPRKPGNRPHSKGPNGNGPARGNNQPRERAPKHVPPGQATRDAAVSLLTAVIGRGEALDTALSADKEFNQLDDRNRALARAIVGTTLRRHGAIEEVLGRFIDRPPRNAGVLLPVLEVAVAQLLFMGIADHAAVSVAVDQVTADRDARHFKGLANAVLRRVGRERETLLASLPADIDTPEWLHERWTAAYGAQTAAAMETMHRIEPSLDLSVKDDAAGWAQKLGGIVLPTGSVRLVPSGPIEALPGFAEGAWWVQDAAAALPARLLGDVAGKRVADLCAAPGGKTAALATAGANVTAVDVSGERIQRLHANLQRLRLVADVVIADVLKWQPAEKFDAVLLDAPCSATGTIRRHPDVAWLKKPEDITTLAAMQARMIRHAATLLKPGGTLVFCTCSLEPEEGPAHLAGDLAAAGLVQERINPDEVGGLAELITPEGAVRTLPSHLSHAEPRLAGLDGFFMARFRLAG